MSLWGVLRFGKLSVGPSGTLDQHTCEIPPIHSKNKELPASLSPSSKGTAEKLAPVASQ